MSQTFLDTYTDMCKAGIPQGAAKATKQFLTYALGDGQKTLGSGSSQLPYAGLTATLVSKAQAQLAKLTCNGSAL